MKNYTISLRRGMFQVEMFQGGIGMPLLFLHGIEGLEPGTYLQQLCEHFTVYAPLCPGFGQSTGQQYLEDITDLALFYYQLLDELQLPSVAVMGHSFGGMVAAEMAALSNRIQRLVLVAPLGLWREDTPVLDFFTVSPEDLAAYWWHDLANFVGYQEFLAAMTIDWRLTRSQALAVLTKFLWPIPDKGLKRRLYRIQSPTLIIWGQNDRLVDSIYAQEFGDRITHSETVLIPNCGHLPMLEAPDQFMSVVNSFLGAAKPLMSQRL